MQSQMPILGSQLASDIERGLTRDEFFFVFHPRLGCAEGQISGFELLMRWCHPIVGILEPSAFISFVADSEFAGTFTDLLLSRASDVLANWKAHGYCSLTLSVNMSSLELTRADLPQKLAAVLSARDIDARCLQIELTDVVEPARLDLLADAINAVRATGVLVALDDFGAGLTSFTLLHQLPVDIVKIDQSLLRDVPGNPESKRILEALVRMGQRLGKKIVLEGVETAAQFEWARSLPEIECQGYYISRPITDLALDQLVREIHAH